MKTIFITLAFLMMVTSVYSKDLTEANIETIYEYQEDYANTSAASYFSPNGESVFLITFKNSVGRNQLTIIEIDLKSKKAKPAVVFEYAINYRVMNVTNAGLLLFQGKLEPSYLLIKNGLATSIPILTSFKFNLSPDGNLGYQYEYHSGATEIFKMGSTSNSLNQINCYDKLAVTVKFSQDSSKLLCYNPNGFLNQHDADDNNSEKMKYILRYLDINSGNLKEFDLSNNSVGSIVSANPDFVDNDHVVFSKFIGFWNMPNMTAYFENLQILSLVDGTVKNIKQDNDEKVFFSSNKKMFVKVKNTTLTASPTLNASSYNSVSLNEEVKFLSDMPVPAISNNGRYLIVYKNSEYQLYDFTEQKWKNISYLLRSHLSLDTQISDIKFSENSNTMTVFITTKPSTRYGTFKPLKVLNLNL